MSIRCEIIDMRYEINAISNLHTEILILKSILKYSGAYIGGVYLFPFRTEKSSPPEPMVLQ